MLLSFVAFLPLYFAGYFVSGAAHPVDHRGRSMRSRSPAAHWNPSAASFFIYGSAFVGNGFSHAHGR